MDSALISIEKARLRDLELELEAAQLELNKAEATLAAEQAAVNRFRMHARLKIGVQVDEVLSLQSKKQSLLTRLRMAEMEEDDPFWEARKAEFPKFNISDDTPEHIILPTDVPRDRAAEKRLFRELAKRFHPDLAEGMLAREYATTMMAAVNDAYQNGDLTTLRNLAGEPDPADAIQFEKTASLHERKLQKRLYGIHRRIRKVGEQFQAMKRENTARLWRKAQSLEEAGLSWWNEVRIELEAESLRLSDQIAVLEQLLKEAVTDHH
jgi:hypothetical protein